MTNFQIYGNNIHIYVNNLHLPNLWCEDSNSQPQNHESPAMTIRPGVQPLSSEDAETKFLLRN